MKFFFLILFFSVHSFALLKSWHSNLPDESNKFQITEELEDRVNFWVKIYSHYSTTQGVFHLVDKPSFILGEIDLTDISTDSSLTVSEQKKLIERRVKEKKAEIISKFNISDSRKVRLQMGLRDRMRKALYLSGKYLPQMEAIFKKENLPIELTRLVFVESSFNVFAQSKVGASGLWQIMPYVAKPKGYITKNYDKRNHPFYATKLAAKIMRDNYKGLKAWPLAITAYNHGLTGVRRMTKLARSNRIEDLIASKKVTRTWGFASKNFYACFLAVLEVERNAQELFGDDLIKAEKLAFREYKLKNKTDKSELLKLFNGSVSRFRQMNPHLNWKAISRKKVVPAGVPLLVPIAAKNSVAQDN